MTGRRSPRHRPRDPALTMTGSVWKMRSAGKDTMTQYHRIHPNLSLTQNPTSRDLLVAFQIPISLMELQMEVELWVLFPPYHTPAVHKAIGVDSLTLSEITVSCLEISSYLRLKDEDCSDLPHQGSGSYPPYTWGSLHLSQTSPERPSHLCLLGDCWVSSVACVLLFRER